MQSAAEAADAAFNSGCLCTVILYRVARFNAAPMRDLANSPQMELIMTMAKNCPDVACS